jgi:hypothetical protein
MIVFTITLLVIALIIFLYTSWLFLKLTNEILLDVRGIMDRVLQSIREFCLSVTIVSEIVIEFFDNPVSVLNNTIRALFFILRDILILIFRVIIEAILDLFPWVPFIQEC